MAAFAASPAAAMLALFGAALLLTLPACFGPPRLNDSFWIDWVWLDQFARELASGNLYPRWLPLSHHGLGSPVFYYYPPLAFYLGSLFVLAGLTTYAAVIATFSTAYLLSGAAMYLWLRSQSKMPLTGSLIYMAAPYHAFNFYVRGALAEALATAIIPLVLLGLRKLGRGERGGFALSAGSYAALIITHLPLALLASIFLIGPYVLVQAKKAPDRFAAVGAALAAGLMLSGIYLVPAVMLEPYRDSAKLWADPMLRPYNWTFWNPAIRSSKNYIAVLIIGVSLSVPLCGLVARHRSRWALGGLIVVALAVGLVPIVWTLPLLKSVQFPFRLFPIAEFALASGIATAAPGLGESAIALAALLSATVPITASISPAVVSLDELASEHPDVPENLPPGERPYSWPSRWALQVASTHETSRYAEGVTVAPVFYFPAWQVTCGGRDVAMAADGATKLLSFHHSPEDCRRRLILTSAEKIGIGSSLLGMFAILMSSLAGLATRRSELRRRKVSFSLGISK